MSKAVLISIRPKWCEKIASGEKTIEVRKNRPKLQTPFKCYIYCTKDGDQRRMVGARGKVIGEFVCDKMYKIERDIYPEQGIFFDEIGAFSFRVPMLSDTCLKEEEIGEYMKGCEGYGWNISNLKIYDMRKELREFTGLRKTKFGAEYVPIARPPQSWCYVEELR